MKKIVICVIIGLSGIFFIAEAKAQTAPGEVTGQMRKFSWMVGDWQGEAWYLGRDQKETHIIQKEHILIRLDSTIITMEGSGYEKTDGSEEAKTVFQAFGILTYDLSKSKFVLRAYKGGNFIDSDFTSNPDGSFSWGMEFPSGKTRYTLRFTSEGKWIETGEFSQDGIKWNKIFEMTLVKL